MNNNKNISSKIKSAIKYRDDFYQDEDTTAFRVFNSDGDEISGLTIDFFDGFYLITFFNTDIYKYKNEIVDELKLAPLYKGIYQKKKFNSNDKDAILSKLSNLKLMNKRGMMIPLSEFVTIEEQLQEPTLTSKNLKHMINVIAQTDMDSQIYPLLDARTYILENFTNEYEVSKSDMLNLTLKDKKTGEVFDIVFDGELKVTIDTFIELGGAFIAALVLIFLLMVVYYKNFAIAGAIVLGSFVSLIGVIFGHFVMDLFTVDTFYLTATSLIGFIALIGINSRNSLLIIDFSMIIMKDKGFDATKAIAVATATRAKPILLTVLAIVFASSLLSRDAVFGGLGVALIGGTLIAYLVSLFFVPVTILGSLKKMES